MPRPPERPQDRRSRQGSPCRPRVGAIGGVKRELKGVEGARGAGVMAWSAVQSGNLTRGVRNAQHYQTLQLQLLPASVRSRLRPRDALGGFRRGSGEARRGRPDVITGVLAKIRMADLPSLAKPGGKERPMPAANDEGVQEKLSWGFFRERNILVMQGNRYVGTHAPLTRVLRECTSGAVKATLVVVTDKIKELDEPGLELLDAIVQVAKPTHPDQYDAEDSSDSALELLSGSGSDVIEIHLGLDARRASSSGHLKKGWTKRWLKNLLRLGASKAKVKVASVGEEARLIDLISNKVQTKKTIQMDGRYASHTSAVNAIKESYSEYRHTILSLFSENDS